MDLSIMSLKPTYRPLEHKDIPQVQKTLLHTWIDSYSAFIPNKDIQWYLQNTYSESYFLALLGEKQTWSYIAEVQEHIVGYARAHINDDEQRLYMSSLYVLPEFQGQGIGTSLLTIIENEALQQSYTTIWLGVMTQNVPSLTWYKKLGFLFVEEAPFRMGETTVNHLIGFRMITR